MEKPQFFKSFLLYGIGAILNKLIPFFLLPFYTNFFSPSEYGMAEVLTTLIFLINVLGTLQLESSAARFFFEEDNENRKEKLSAAIILLIIVSTFLGFLLYNFASSISLILFSNDKGASAIKVSSGAVLFINIYSFLNIVVRFSNKPVHFTLISLLQLLVSLAVPIILIKFLNFNIEGIFWGQLSGHLVASFLLLIILRRFFTLKANFSRLKKWMSYSTPLIPGVFINWLNNYGTKFILIIILPFNEIGIISASMKVASVFTLLEYGVRLAWPPYFWKNYHIKTFKTTHSNLLFFFLNIFLFLSIIFSLFGPDIYKIIIEDSFTEGAVLVTFFGVAYAINFIMPFINLGPSIRKVTILSSLAYTLSFITYFSFAFLLHYFFELTGIALAFLIGRLLLLIIFWNYQEKFFPLPFPTSLLIIFILIPFGFSFSSLFTIPVIIKIILIIALIIYFYIVFRKNKFINLLKA